MKINLCIPNSILVNSKLSNRDIAIILFLYRKKDNYNRTRLTLDEIADGVGERYFQSVKRSLKKTEQYQYYSIEKDTRKRGSRNVYVLPKLRGDFTFIPNDIYDRFCKEPDIIVNYLKLKRIQFIVKDKSTVEIEDYMSLGEWSEKEFLSITKTLQSNGLIKTNFSIEFLLEEVSFENENNADDEINAGAEKNKKPKSNQSLNNKLLDYFYNKIQMKSSNEGRDRKNIKKLLDGGYTEEQIIFIMDYLNIKGKKDLGLLSTLSNEAISTKKIMDEGDITGTVGNLIKKYHKGLNIQPNKILLNSYAAKIEEVISNYSFDIAEKTIDYMINHKIEVLNYITDNVSKVIKINKINENPAFMDRCDLDYIKSDLINARTTVKASSKYQENKIAKEILFNNKFNQKYSALEWAYKVKIQLDKDVTDYLNKNIEFKLIEQIDDDKKKDIRDKILSWLSGQDKQVLQ